jgi:hypothetical protein
MALGILSICLGACSKRGQDSSQHQPRRNSRASAKSAMGDPSAFIGTINVFQSLLGDY